MLVLFQGFSLKLLPWFEPSQITDSGKQPITIQLEFTGIPSFAPMPPDKHVIKASNLIELYVKLERWLG